MEICKNKKEFLDFVTYYLSDGVGTLPCAEAKWTINEEPETEYEKKTITATILKDKPNEIRYAIPYNFTVTRQSVLNVSCATAVINWRLGEKKSPCYLDFDLVKKTVSVKMTAFVEREQLDGGIIAGHVRRLEDVFDDSCLEFHYLLNKNCNPQVFVENLADMLELTYSKIGQERMNDLFITHQNFREAYEEMGLTASHQFENIHVKMPIKWGDGNMNVLVRLGLRERDEVIQIDNVFPRLLSPERCLDGAMCVAYLNSRVEYGSFDFDIYQGKFVYRMIVDVRRMKLSKETATQIWNMVSETLSKYRYAVNEFVKGKLKVEELKRKINEA